MDGCYLDFESPCERCGKCGFVEKEEEESEEIEMSNLDKITRAISKIDTANGMIVIAHMIPEVKHAIGLIAEASILLGEAAEYFEEEE